jgi:hypothetical protein
VLLLDLPLGLLPLDPARLEPPQLVAQDLLGPEDLVLYLSLHGLPGDEHVPEPVRVAVEEAAGAAGRAGFGFFSGRRAVLGPVLEAGAAERFLLAHVTWESAPKASACTFRGSAVGCSHGEAGCANVVKNVDIALDPAVAATVRAATHRAKGGELGAAGAHASVDIGIAPEPTPRASGRALVWGGKASPGLVAGGAHFVFQVDIPLDPAPRAVHSLATARAKRRLLAAPALLVHHIHIPYQAARAAPESALGASGGKRGHFFAAGGAHIVCEVDIPLDPAPRAVHGLATARAKRRHLAAPALLVHHIHIPYQAARAAPERTLGACGGKGGFFSAAGGAHFVFQVDIPLDPAPRAVHFLSARGAKRWHLAAPALLGHNIHISRQATPAAPERLLGASAGERGVFFAADGALARHFLCCKFCFFTLSSRF